MLWFQAGTTNFAEDVLARRKGLSEDMQCPPLTGLAPFAQSPTAPLSTLHLLTGGGHFIPPSLSSLHPGPTCPHPVVRKLGQEWSPRGWGGGCPLAIRTSRVASWFKVLAEEMGGNEPSSNVSGVPRRPCPHVLGATMGPIERVFAIGSSGSLLHLPRSSELSSAQPATGHSGRTSVALHLLR